MLGSHVFLKPSKGIPFFSLGILLRNGYASEFWSGKMRIPTEFLGKVFLYAINR